MPFVRKIVADLAQSLDQQPQLIQAVVGPRQVGKTTAAEQAIERLSGPSHFAAADLPLPPGPDWIEAQWNIALAKTTAGRPVTLILDEVQKVHGWAEVLKRLWDERRRAKLPIRAAILGSSALLLQHGLTESLAGRFFLHRCSHWQLDECRAAFGWDLEQWLYFGGYPGAAALASSEAQWRRYVVDSLVDSVLSRDIYQLQRVAKPALMRNLFGLATTFPAQILSYNKMVGQLQEAGNTTTLANYLHLLSTAFFVSGLELFSLGHKRKRGSSPKLILWNNALVNAFSTLTLAETRADAAWRGRLVENAVGAHFLNGLPETEWKITYWREGDNEVDFVLHRGKQLYAVEVKSGRPSRAGGLAAFQRHYPSAKPLIVGSGGLGLDEFFSKPPEFALV